MGLTRTFRACAALGLSLATAALVSATAQDAAAATYAGTSVMVTGHGYGHGIGMGQYGALGYAIGQDNGDGNETYQWIVSHFYGGTTLEAMSSLSNSEYAAGDATPVHVVIVENNGDNVITTSSDGVVVAGVSGSHPAVMFVPHGDNKTYDVYTSSSCGGGGGWVLAESAVAQPSATDAAGGLITLCQTGYSYHGAIVGTYNTATTPVPRTMSVLALNQYLDDVVPAESPETWGSLGGAGPQSQDWGFQELEAQAVAARSYVASGLGTYGGYADTCDSGCQSYPGTKYESTISDAAVADTAGMVMVTNATGGIADTEYSSSSGGYSAGYPAGYPVQSPFPAVADDGDGVCVSGACNANHNWSASISVSSIESTFPTIGQLESIAVSSNNGDGAGGGRALYVEITGTSASVSVLGTTFATDFNLLSNWFTFGSPTSGYWLASSTGGVYSFGTAGSYGSMAGQTLSQPIVGMAATPDAKGYWLVAADGGIFSFGDAVFHGSTGAMHLNKPIVGMAPTTDGKGYWLVASDGGIFSFGDAVFHGSTGAMHLNKPIVGMAATPDAKGYWLVASDGGIFSFGDATYFGSTGAMMLNQPITAMASTTDGKGYWLVAADGGIFNYGDAAYEGSGSGTSGAFGTLSLLPSVDDKGYDLATVTGNVLAYGDASTWGDMATSMPGFKGQIVGAAPGPFVSSS